MADSDDDMDRSRGRDKFRRERIDNVERNRSYRGEKRTWRDVESEPYGARRRSRDEYESEGRKRLSGGYGRGRDWSPPSAKRMRRDHWSAGFPVPGMMMPYGMRPPWSMPPHPAAQIPHGLPIDSEMGDTSTQTTKRGMLSFKQFLTQQEDDIEEAAAIASYNDYKAEFKKRVIEEFFEEHKEEDWLISKYHPKRVAENKERDAANLENRVKAFSFLLESRRLDNLSLTVDNSDEITKVMDTAVIKMEGGSDLDLLALEGTGDQTEEGQTKDSPSVTEKEKESVEKSPEDGSTADDAEETKSADSKNEEGSPAKAVNGMESDKPRALHVTRSVYIRHIPAKITADDIIEVCKTVPGFLRVAFADPAPDRQYERRGWATYSGDTDIRDVVSRLTTKKIKDHQLSCMLNRDLSRRVKQSSSSAMWARKALQTDIQQAIKLIKFLDEKVGLWEHAPSSEETTSNPVFSFPQSLLEEEPVAMATGGEDEEGAISDPATELVDGNSEQVKLLDRLLWYLRIVHSLDYYSGTVFPSEDSMPHRCGLFTVRAQQPSGSITHEEVSEYVEGMEEKVKPLLVKVESLSEEEVIKMGKKDPEAEVERFVELNTQKLAESKYLCPLSGKKFKGPEFVRKHIFNKHVDKVEAFKQEAEFFNSYIRDPERPMPLESTVSSSILSAPPKTPGSEDGPSGGGVLGSGGGPWGQGGMGMYGRGGGFGPSMGGGFTPPDMMTRGGGGYRDRGGRRGRGRKVVNYQDLDAPEEMY